MSRFTGSGRRVRRKRVWSLAAPVLVALVSLAIGACGSDDDDDDQPATGSASQEGGAAWQETLAAAQEEGSATVLVTDTPEWQEVQAETVEETTGVEMAVAASGPNGDLEARLSAEMEAGAPQTDVYQDVDYSFFTRHKDWFVDLSTAGLPNFNSYPPDQTWQNLCVNTKNGVSGVTYNTDLVAEDQVPTSWEDLLDPYWNGKMILSNPAPGGYYMQWALMMRDAFGPDFLEGIAAQEPTLDDSSVSAAEKVASGAAEISVLSQLDSASALVKKGAPVKWIPLRDPDIGSHACVGILKDSPHPEAAKVLLNFLMSEESQSASCNAGVPNVSPVDAEGCHEVPADFKYPVMNPEGTYEGMHDEAQTSQALEELGID